MREKLIELLEEFPKICVDGVDCKDCQYNKENGGVGCTSLLADHLISSGVVVRGKGEWIDRSPYMGHYCSRCGRITGNAILYDGTLISKFCDNCGADMRGEQRDD